MKKSRKLDFLPNVNNRYSIRKFTVGTASILLGVTLIFGASNDEAKAAEKEGATENVESSTASDGVTSDENLNREETTEVTKEEPANNEITTEASNIAKNEATSNSIEENDDTNENTPESTTEPTSNETDNEKAETETTPNETLKENTTSENPQTLKEENSTSTANEDNAESHKQIESNNNEKPEVETSTDSSNQTQSTVEKEDLSTNKNSDNSDKITLPNEAATEVDGNKEVIKANNNISNVSPDINRVTDRATAVDYYAKAANITTKEAEKVISDLNLDGDKLTAQELQFALINALANQQNANTPVATAFRAAPTAANRQATNLAAATPTALSIGSKEIIEADALANGYINSSTDASNAANTLSGRAWVVDRGTPATTENGLSPVPEGTKVYMQWIDKDGSVSPTYVASTTNKLSSSNASQVGPGAYAFDLRKAWVDALGNEHKYRAVSGQYYRLWIEDFQTVNGNTASMIRQAGGFFPGSYVNSVTNSSLGQFPLVGTNMQRTGVFMGVRPTNDYVTKERQDWIHDEQGPINNIAVSTNARNTVSGNVWLETGAGDYANSGTGPNDNNKDPQAEGYTVIMSSLTNEGAQAYKAQVDSLPEGERADAAKTLLTDHPEYISATVYGETDSEGRYTLRFPKDSLNPNYLYGYVTDPEGNIVKTYSSYTSPEFRKPNSNLSWTPQASPGQNLVQNPMWYNVNFAVVPNTDINLNIVNFNNTDKPAIPGDTVNIDLTGGQLSPIPTNIEWRDKNGNVVQKTEDITSLTDGEQKGVLVVPETAKDGDVYTVYLVAGGNNVAADSFIVKITDERTYEPESNGVTKDYGTGVTTEDVINSVTVPNYPENKEDYTVAVDDPAQLPNGTQSGTTNVGVTVTYPDGTTDHITVPVTIGEQADNDAYQPQSNGVNKDYGTGVTADEVIGSVTVPNYPENKGDYTVAVDDPAQLPNGTQSGTTNVGVTVTYPDGTTDHITVPVTIGEQADNDAYEPQSNGVNKDYGTGVTADEVIGSVTVPNYPEDKGDYTVSVDNPEQLPNGNEAGTTNVGVTVTYPDGTTDHITVPVTIGEQADNDAYEPQSNGVNKDYGTGVTADEVIGSVTVPNYPEDKGDYTVSVDNPEQLPNGNEAGTTNVGVTVTYPDGTTDHITVPVTIGEQADNDAYEPQSNGVNKDYGTGVTTEDVINSVTVPNYPEDKGDYTVAVDDPAQLPNGNEAGTTNVGVTVTYPDGTTDHITVPVTIGEQADNDAYQPQSNGVNKDYGTGVTADEVIGSVTVPNYPENKGDYTVAVDDPAQLPNGTQSGTTNVGVTVTYPDGTTDHITVPVTIGEQADNDAYQPQSNGVNKDYGTGVTADEVIGSVTVPNYPADKGTPNITVDSPEQLPNGNEAGTTNVGVTVTYPDGTTDHITVPVTIGEQADNDAYEPQSNGVNKDYGTGVTTEDVINSVTVPNYPEDKGDYTVSVDNPAQLPDGTQSGTTNVGVTVTYPDGTTDHITVPVTIGEQADNDAYQPESNGVNKDYGTGVTADEVIGSVTVPNYPEGKGDYTVSVDNPEQLPNGNEAGTTDVGVTVTYPDGTTDHITVPVTIGEQPDNDAYQPQSNGVNKDYGTGVTTEDVINSVTVPNYPEDKGDYTVSVDNPAQLPDGTQSGTTNVGVTVTYPDGTTDHITVPVTIGEQADNDAYQPESNGVNKDYGTGVTADEVIGSVTVPNYPEGKGTPNITVDSPEQLPNGNEAGTTNVGVTVTYPDGTTDHITVPVTIGEQSDNDAYEPQSNGVNKDYGTGVTTEDVINSVTVPNYPENKGDYTVTVDNPNELPNGNEAGTTNVGVTVTYPDGTTDHITVPVTIGEQADNDAYEPQSNGVNKDHGTGVTAEDIIGSVTIPNYPEGKEVPKVTIDDPSQLPDGSQSGTTNVGVTVTYPDGTTDHITVPVTIGEQADNDAYEPQSNGVNKDHGTGVTAEDIIGSVTIPNYPEGKETPKVTIDDPTQLPDGTQSGTTNVGVTVTYPDGTTDHITVPVTIGEQPDNDAYEPQSNGVNKDHGTGVTVEDIIGSVTIPNYPEGKETPKVTIDDPTQLPDGSQSGTTSVGVTVTYPDGTTNHITVPVTIGEQADNDAYEPQSNGVNKDHGTGVTVEDIIGSVTIPNYPEGKETPKVTIDDPSQLPDGSQSGTTNVGVTVTYPDGTTDHITVPVTIGEQADNDAYEPQSNGVNKDHGTGVTVEDIIGSVTIPNYPEGKETPKVTIDDPTQLPDGSQSGTTDVGVTVTYPDGTTDHITVSVTIGEQVDKDGNEPKVEGITKKGTGVTVEDVIGVITVPDYQEDKGTPQVTVDNPNQLPDGTQSGTTDVAVTVTYPDGKASHINVPVTIVEQAEGQSEESKNNEQISNKGNQKSLPDTGGNDNNATVFGTLFAGLGYLLFIGRRKRNKDQ